MVCDPDHDMIDDDLKTMFNETLLLPIHLCNELTTYLEQMPKELREFYDTNLSIKKSEEESIFIKTIEQSKSPDWFLQRKFRVTASCAHKIAKARKTETR